MADAWILRRRWPGLSEGLGTVSRVRVGGASPVLVRSRARIVAIVNDVS